MKYFYRHEQWHSQKKIRGGGEGFKQKILNFLFFNFFCY
uniref:Uncharacterized protein n=1 Tax=Ciona intestinalis TaxID=7719 RepID=H2XX87_CIOIN